MASEARGSAIDQLETQAARFVRAAVEQMPPVLRSLPFVSPLSVRTPDLWPAWHHGYRARHRWSVAAALVAGVPVDLCKGLARLLPHSRRYGAVLYGKPSPNLLVVPASCGRTAAADRFVTPYVATEPDDAVYVFSQSDLGPGFRRWACSLKRDVMGPFVALLKAGIVAGRRSDGAWPGRFVVLALWLSWVFSLRWLFYLLLERDLTEIANARQIRRLACVHEMHAHARIVWRVARSRGATGHTVQHAVFARDKRWLFPDPAEVAAGLAVPDVFHVFDRDTAEMLRASLPSTRFELGASGRYAGMTAAPASTAGREWLFVTALPAFDSRAVLLALRRLFGEGAETRPLRVRLHPSASLGWRERIWLRVVAPRRGVAVSRTRDLTEDLREAAVVIGMGSTALVEALLNGRPVVQIEAADCPRYLDLGSTPGCAGVAPQGLSASFVRAAETLRVDRAEAARLLGLGNPVVTFRGLFSTS